MSRIEILSKNITAVVRSVNERTESLCINLLKEDLFYKNIKLIKNVSPFSKAHELSMLEGLKEGRKYTLIIDADVLVAQNSIWHIFKFFEAQNNKVFEIHSLMLDQFFGGTRYGGVKLYRTSLIDKAIELIPKDSIRPETDMILGMKSIGYLWVLFNYKACIHDFYQNYEDIFRKGYTHAAKHAQKGNNNVSVLLPFWKREASKSADFAVLLKGYEHFMKHPKKIKLDFKETSRDIQELLSDSNIRDREELDPKTFSQKQIRDFINSYKSPEEYYIVKRQLEDNLPKDERSLFIRLLSFLKYKSPRMI